MTSNCITKSSMVSPYATWFLCMQYISLYDKLLVFPHKLIKQILLSAKYFLIKTQRLEREKHFCAIKFSERSSLPLSGMPWINGLQCICCVTLLCASIFPASLSQSTGNYKKRINLPIWYPHFTVLKLPPSIAQYLSTVISLRVILGWHILGLAEYPPTCIGLCIIIFHASLSNYLLNLKISQSLCGLWMYVDEKAGCARSCAFTVRLCIHVYKSLCIALD